MKCINILITVHLNKLIGIEKNDVEIVDPTIPLLEWVVNNFLKVCGAIGVWGPHIMREQQPFRVIIEYSKSTLNAYSLLLHK